MTNFPNHGDTVSEVYEALKLCMYDIKQAGGNQMRYYSAEINQNQESFQLSLELKKALEEEQFIFHYQPIVDVSNNRKIIAVESLVRWNHPTRGLLYPGKFISLLESSGNLEKVGLSGFEKGVSFIRQVKLETEQDIKISVNLSPRQILINKNIVFFKRIADKYRIKPENIIIELPDFASYSNNLNLLKNTTQLMNLGFRIAIDVDTVDYKIINAIPNYPINIIKINAKILKGNDKSFVASFVENLSELAIRSKIEVIAEGVESLEQQEVFTRYGINLMQGYFHYEPIDENKLKETMLHNINITWQRIIKWYNLI